MLRARSLFKIDAPQAVCGYLDPDRRLRLPNVTIWKRCGAARRAAGVGCW